VSRYEFIRTEKAFPVAALCRVLQVSRAAYYAWLHRKPSPRRRRGEDLQLKVKAVHDRSRGTYGSPRVHEQLRRAGEVVSEKTVAKIMQEEGIAARSAEIQGNDRQPAHEAYRSQSPGTRLHRGRTPTGGGIINRVRLFCGNWEWSDLGHLTLLRRGLGTGSGSGISPFA
jgi:hypothetical protein